MDKKQIKKAVAGISLASLLISTAVVTSGCKEAEGSCGKGSCGSKSQESGKTSCGKGSCGK